MYKTGDRGYWNENGEVVCLGRNDRQIKLRGFRLDMNDLEIRSLQAAPQLQAIAIAPRRGHLVAMVQPASIDIQDLRKRFSAVLPSYAIMQQIMAVERLPITPTGKVDYRKVAEMAPNSPNRRASPLITSTEKVIAQAFRKLLKLDQKAELRTDSDFVDLGGHSLLQLFMSSRLTKAFGFRIPLPLIIENPTRFENSTSIILERSLVYSWLFVPPTAAVTESNKLKSFPSTYLNKKPSFAGNFPSLYC